MKKAEKMEWIVHPHSFRSKPEVSVVHESDFTGLRSYGWFSKTKILVYKGEAHRAVAKDLHNIALEYAKHLCEKMNREHPVSIKDCQAAIDLENKRIEHTKALTKPLDDMMRQYILDHGKNLL